MDDPIEIIQDEIGDMSKVRAVALARVSRVVPIPLDHLGIKFLPHQREQFLKDFKDFADYNWDAVLDYEKTLRGYVGAQLFVVRQRGSPGKCDLRKPPVVGEMRVVYIREDNRVYDVDPMFVQLDDPEVRLKPPYTMPN